MNKSLAFGLIAVVGSFVSARADIIPTFESVGASLDGQNTVWTYQIDITAEQNATTGDFFTIYDFGNIIPNSGVAPSGWTLTTSLVGLTPVQTLPVDNPTVLNLTWTYTGPTIIGNSPAGQDIGPFSVTTAGAFNPNAIVMNNFGKFAAQGTAASGPNAGTKVDNVGDLAVPLIVPEPSTIALIIGSGGLGVIGRALARRRR